MASAFLGVSAEKRTPRLGRNSLKPRAKHRVVWKSGEPDLSKNAGHFRGQIHRNAVGFAQFNAECMQGEHRPFSEPPSLAGAAGSSGLVTLELAFATVTRVKRRISDVTPIRLFAFYGNNAVVALASSGTTVSKNY